MTLFVTIVYVLVTIVLILVVLLQAGRGGGLGTALGGGASQGVFGGSGGADFLAKLTQGLAITFMVCAVYLAYASTHSGSSLQSRDQGKDDNEGLVASDEPVDYESIGQGRPLELPEADAIPKAIAPLPTAPSEEAEPAAPPEEAEPAAPSEEAEPAAPSEEAEPAAPPED